nr:hypothetical protein CFP56_28270 [Quercus suber]POE82866.1 hypothetical protein CFP56_28271 [Quercus suber]
MHSHSPTATTKQSPENLSLLNYTRKKDETSLPSLAHDQDQSVAVPGQTSSPSSTGSLFFKDALLHAEMEATDTCPIGVDKDWIMDPIGDTTDSLDLAIPLPPHVREKIYASWKNNLIVKVVGKSFGYKALLLRLTGIWRPKGTISMIDLGYEFFLVRFTQLTDYLTTLERGPWFVGEHYLSVNKWEPEFQAAKATVTSLAAWIRLPDLPIEFFHPKILRSIGNRIGRFIRIDAITNTIAR